MCLQIRPQTCFVRMLFRDFPGTRQSQPCRAKLHSAFFTSYPSAEGLSQSDTAMMHFLFHENALHYRMFSLLLHAASSFKQPLARVEEADDSSRILVELGFACHDFEEVSSTIFRQQLQTIALSHAVMLYRYHGPDTDSFLFVQIHARLCAVQFEHPSTALFAGAGVVRMC